MQQIFEIVATGAQCPRAPWNRLSGETASHRGCRTTRLGSVPRRISRLFLPALWLPLNKSCEVALSPLCCKAFNLVSRLLYFLTGSSSLFRSNCVVCACSWLFLRRPSRKGHFRVDKVLGSTLTAAFHYSSLWSYLSLWQYSSLLFPGDIFVLFRAIFLCSLSQNPVAFFCNIPNARGDCICFDVFLDLCAV